MTNTFYKNTVKPIFDFIISFFLIIVLLPIFLLISILIKIDSKGPIFYIQTRLGKNKKQFKIYKFRTMVIDAGKLGPEYTKSNDTRITKAGKFLRKTSLDELPQLFNVLKGDMSLVGFRPGTLKNYNNDDLNSTLFSVKPGITGLAQVNGRSSISTEQKRKYEILYSKTISFKQDINILLKTLKIVVNYTESN
ncbi:sugar transferase [Facklamia sp. P12937]|uniref:sugar transferase n=1 Tax=Facklamia sp. P12937 TaxID=3421949 RepID=UPI003D168679